MTYPIRYVLLIATLLLLPVGAATAQQTLFTIEDASGTVVLRVLDDGTVEADGLDLQGGGGALQCNGCIAPGRLADEAVEPGNIADDAVTGPTIHPDAIQGGTDVTITRDGTDNVVISATGGGLTLPFSGMATDPGPAFSMENTGAGPAGRFEGTDGAGLQATSANSIGVGITALGGDAINVQAAGSPSTTSGSSANNGVEVQGAEGNGLFVGRADQDGLRVESAGSDGLRVESAGSDGLRVDLADDDGVQVGSAGGDGVYVGQVGSPSSASEDPSNKNGVEIAGAEGHGLFVGQADQDGVLVESAGSPSTTNSSGANNGVEVQGAEGNGLFVGRADNHGVLIDEAGFSGVAVTSAALDGVSVGSAGSNGVEVNNAGGFGGFFVNNSSSETLYARQNGSGDIIEGADGNGSTVFRVETDGDVFADGSFNGGGADLAEAFAVEGPTTAYEPGDVLVISGTQVRTVRKSTDAYSTRVAGVYATKPGVLLSEADSDLTGTVPMGVVGVIPTKVSAENGPIRIGDLLVTASKPGHAMKADPVLVDGVPIYPTGTILGKALAPFDGPGTGVIEVLVNVK